MTTYYYQSPNGQRVEFETVEKVSDSDNYDLYSINSVAGFSITNLHFKKLKDALKNAAYQAKIEYMIRNKPPLNPSENTKICWPLHCVYDADQNFVGYMLPQVIDNSSDLQMLLTNDTSLTGDWRLFVHNTQNSYDLRIKTCLNICQALSPIVELNLYSFDSFTPNNIKVTTDGEVSLVDCELVLEPITPLTVEPDLTNHQNQDSLTVAPQRQVAYTPPEMLDEQTIYGTKTEAIERFSLAVILYQLMFRIHPFLTNLTDSVNQSQILLTTISKGLFVHGKGKAILYNIPAAHQGFDALNPKLKQLFQLAFELDTKDERPTPHIWLENLSALISDDSHGLKPNLALLSKVNTTKPIPTATSKDSLSGTASDLTPSSVDPDNVYLQPNSPFTAAATKKNNLQNAAIIVIAIIAIGIVAYFAFANKSSEDNSEPEPGLNTAAETDSAEYDTNVLTPVTDSSSDDNGDDDDIDYSDPVVPEVQSRYDDELEQQSNPLPITEYKVTNRSLYVSTIRANVRQRPSLSAPVVAELEYNTRVLKTTAPVTNDGERLWVYVATTTGVRGWMSNRVLTAQQKPVVYSACDIRANEAQYVVSAISANVRSSARKAEGNVLGVIQQGEIVCPYMYVGSNDSKIGRWMGFELTNGEIGWIAESILEPVYGASGGYDSDYYDEDDGYEWY